MLLTIKPPSSRSTSAIEVILLLIGVHYEKGVWAVGTQIEEYNYLICETNIFE
jgi:hypothetical protein